jgi:GMP synthase (glutamine-hydrolysing)
MRDADAESELRSFVGSRRVFILVSGGVDSTVAYTFLQKLFGRERVYGLLVDTGTIWLHSDRC